MHAETHTHKRSLRWFAPAFWSLRRERISQMKINKLNVDASIGRGAEVIFQWQFTKQNGQIESSLTVDLDHQKTRFMRSRIELTNTVLMEMEEISGQNVLFFSVEKDTKSRNRLSLRFFVVMKLDEFDAVAIHNGRLKFNGYKARNCWDDAVLMEKMTVFNAKYDGFHSKHNDSCSEMAAWALKTAVLMQ